MFSTVVILFIMIGVARALLGGEDSIMDMFVVPILAILGTIIMIGIGSIFLSAL